MIEGDIRREKIIEIMSNQKRTGQWFRPCKKIRREPSGIVQDIALLRATIRIF